MDVLPSTQDLDSAGSATDWFAGTVGGLTIPPVSGGIAFSNQGAGEVLYRTDFGGSIQRQNIVSQSFTIEASVRVLGPLDSGDVGQFGFALDPGGSSSSYRLNVDTNRVNLDGNGNGEIATGSNAASFVAFRIAYDQPDDEYTAWRDGVEIFSAAVGTNAPFNNGGSFFLGDFTGSLSGEWEVDYIRLTPGAFAPVPEPSSLAMVGLASLIGLRRRRK